MNLLTKKGYIVFLYREFEWKLKERYNRASDKKEFYLHRSYRNEKGNKCTVSVFKEKKLINIFYRIKNKRRFI